MDNPLEVADAAQEAFDVLYDRMDNDDLQEAINLAIKCIAKPKIPNEKVAPLLVQLSAYALEFRMLYSTYMTWKKNENDAAHKKNCYRSMYEGLDRLVDSMKYLVRT